MASQKLISGEEQFQISAAHSFSVGPSASGYSLGYSADGANFTTYTTAVPANEVLVVNGIAKGMFFKLIGNTSDDIVITF